MPGRVYEQLYDVALDQMGYVTPEDARDLGINPQRLVDMARRGVVEREAHGVYRFTAVPHNGREDLMAAVLWPHRTRGVLSHDTALDLYDLCDINPAKVHLTVPAGYRIRRPSPGLYVLHRRDLDERDVQSWEGLPAIVPFRAIADCIETHIRPTLVEQAIQTAQARGMLRRGQADALRELQARR